MKKPIRDQLLEILSANINWEGFTGGNEDIICGIDAILEQFTVKAKRPRKSAEKPADARIAPEPPLNRYYPGEAFTRYWGK